MLLALRTREGRGPGGGPRGRATGGMDQSLDGSWRSGLLGGVQWTRTRPRTQEEEPPRYERSTKVRAPSFITVLNNQEFLVPEIAHWIRDPGSGIRDPSLELLHPRIYGVRSMDDMEGWGYGLYGGNRPNRRIQGG
jgi:hypothetical protein